MSTIFTSSTQLRCSEAQVETFLARPRNTLSARSMNAKQAAAVATTLAASQQLAPSGEALAPAPSGAEQLRAIFCGLDLKKQDQVRLLAYQRIVLEAKMAAMLERLEGRHAWGTEEGDLDMGSGGSEALSRLQRAVDDSQGELVRAVGARVTRDVLRAIWAPDMQEALKLSIMSEEESREKLASTHDEYVALQAAQEQGVEALRGGGSVATRGAANLFQAQERAARLWRRRLWKITIPVRIDAKLRWATAHDDYDNRGRRSLVNDLNRRRPEDHMSYCALRGGGGARRVGAPHGAAHTRTHFSRTLPPCHPLPPLTQSLQTRCRRSSTAGPAAGAAAPPSRACFSRCWTRRKAGRWRRLALAR